MRGRGILCALSALWLGVALGQPGGTLSTVRAVTYADATPSGTCLKGAGPIMVRTTGRTYCCDQSTRLWTECDPATGLPSDPSACPGSQWVTDQNAVGTLVCSQPDFADLASMGSVNPAQIVRVNPSGTGFENGYCFEESGVTSCDATITVQNGNELRLNEPIGAGLNFTSKRSRSQSEDLFYWEPAVAPAAGQVYRAVGGASSNIDWGDASGVGACTTNKWVRALSNNAAPTCTQPAFSDLSGNAAATQGGTGFTSYTLGDILYADTSVSFAKLPGNASTTKMVLTQTGTGSASTAPEWADPGYVYDGTAINVLNHTVTSDLLTLASVGISTWSGSSALADPYTFALIDTNATSDTLLELQSGSSRVFRVGHDGKITQGVWGADAISSAYGGTGFSTGAVGDILYHTGSAWAKLAANSNTTRLFYMSQGDGIDPATPSLVALVSGDVPSLDTSKLGSGILGSARGGTANAFFTVSGPASSIQTFTFPNSSSTVLTTNAAVTVGQGGTGAATFTSNAALIGHTTSAITASSLVTDDNTNWTVGVSPKIKAGNQTTTYSRGGGTYSHSTTTAGNTAATETSLWATTIQANTLNATGDSLSFRAAGTFAATASVNKVVRVKLGSTLILDTGSLAITTAHSWSLNGSCSRTGAAAEKCSVGFTSSSAALTTTTTYTSATESLTANATLDIRGNGTNASDVVFEVGKSFWESTP